MFGIFVLIMSKVWLSLIYLINSFQLLALISKEIFKNIYIYISTIGLISSRVPEADQILPKYRGFLLLANEVLKQLQFR